MSAPAPSQSQLIEEYQSILKKNGISDIVEDVHVEIPPLAGEHLGSDCLCVTLNLKNGSKRELFVKNVSPNAPDFFKDAEMFKKESSFANVLLKDFRAIHVASGLSQPLDFFPNYLHADERTIVMDKLDTSKDTKEAYFLVSKSVKLDTDYAKYVLRNLALFHAMSYGAVSTPTELDTYLEEYPFLKEKFYMEGKEEFDISYNNLLRAKIAIVQASNLPDADNAINFLKQGVGTVYRQVRKAVDHKSNHLFNVVNHGDCWITNMLFRSDPETGVPLHQVFLDFQFVRLGSPNLDLSYFLFSSLQPSFLESNWKHLLEFYFAQLKSNVEQMGNPFVHTFQEFLDDFKSKMGFGFWLNMTLFQGFDIFQHVDMAKLETDVEDTGLGDQIGTWIKGHQERALKLGSEIICLVDVFKQIQDD